MPLSQSESTHQQKNATKASGSS